jgi:hypothetical protein
VLGRVIVVGLLLSGILLTAPGVTAAGKTPTGTRQITFAPFGAAARTVGAQLGV